MGPMGWIRTHVRPLGDWMDRRDAERRELIGVYGAYGDLELLDLLGTGLDRRQRWAVRAVLRQRGYLT